ncbi:MAG: P-loop NTPase [Desulfobacterales bacterium]
MDSDLSNAGHPEGAAPPGGPMLLPVASGKGGVGKSFLAANLAIALAARGRRTILCDLDFGGSSLHRFLGLQNRHPGLSDFLCGHAESLQALTVATRWEGLGFLPGDGWTPLLANLPGGKKAKLIRHLGRLAADLIVLDLGAGSSLNTLDFFGLNPAGLLVATPDAVALTGMLVFLKNALHRRIEKRLSALEEPALARLLRAEREQPLATQAASLEEFADRIAARFPPAAAEIRSVCASLRPRVVLNRSRGEGEAERVRAAEQAMRHKLGLTPEICGWIPEDPGVGEALRRGRAYLDHAPGGRAAEAIHRLAARIDRGEDARGAQAEDGLDRRLIRIPERPPAACRFPSRPASPFGRALRILRTLRP